MSQQTITINGKVYDAHTGLPVDSIPPTNSQIPIHEKHGIITKPREPRKIIQTPRASTARSTITTHPRTRQAQRQSVQRSQAITKFAKPSVEKKIEKKKEDIPHISHPIAVKAQEKQVKKRVVATNPIKPSHIIKQEAIHKALKEAPNHSANHKQHKVKKQPKKFSIVAAGFALFLLGGYFTYINMPNLSVRVAAAQAGVDASFPEYKPDGYSLNGPVGYSSGEVRIDFSANSGTQGFTINQSNTDWDSSALEENYIAKLPNGDRIDPFIERGIKVYIYDSNAVWINKGVLYKLTGDAPLSSDQIRRIAVSM